VPVIAARTGGVLDTVVDGVNGLFFNPQQPAEMRSQVLRLRDDPALRERLAENALHHARSRSWRATMDQLVDYYHTAQRVFRLRDTPIDPAGV
jgi:glycosyltransferase involved in cell wall biosynthesis